MLFYYALCGLVGLSVIQPFAQSRLMTATTRNGKIDRDVHLGKRQNQTLQDCLGASDVPVKFASSSDFDELKEPYNLHYAYNPAVIVLPTTTKHVSDAVQCAAQSDIKVQAKSGGHSYASFSSGGQDGSMIIDLQAFQQIDVDANGVAIVGGGVRLGNLALGIYNKAKRALPHGTCPGVGIGGHATHGGFGYSSRAWGLTLDTVFGMDVVLANGSQTHVDEDSFPDLWFALRGAAADFGVVTTFYLQTLPAPEQVVNWQFSLPNMFMDASSTARVFRHIQDFALNDSLVDRNLGLGIYLDGSGFSISGTYFGSPSAFNDKIAPALLDGLPTPSANGTKVYSWLDSLEALDAAPLEQPLTGYDAHMFFFAKSVVTPASAPLTEAQLEQYFTYINANGVRNATSGTWFSILNLYGGPDSQINAVPTEASAYSDREALWVVQHYGYASGDAGSVYPAGNVRFIEGLNTALTSLMEADGVAFKAYQNYVDPSLSRERAHELYYGRETTEKLERVKGMVDPESVFWNPQSVLG